MPRLKEAEKEVEVSVKTPFQAGCTAYYVQNWKNITSDPRVLGIVTGYKIEFDSEVPQSSSNRRKNFSESETPVIKVENVSMLW